MQEKLLCEGRAEGVGGKLRGLERTEGCRKSSGGEGNAQGFGETVQEKFRELGGKK